MKSNDASIFKLIGDPAENFYSLGQTDKNSFGEIYDQITMLCSRSKMASSLARYAMEFSRVQDQREDKQILEFLKAYADGLERPMSEVTLSFILPEFLASFNRWVPNLMGLIPGCSSLFTYNPENESVNHARILDYALSGPFEKYERSLLYQFKDRYQIFSFSSVGMPFPSLCACNEKGLTLALHYKHGDYFDFKGHSIFGICFNLLSFCSDIKEAKKLLKQYSSMGHWGIYLSDSSSKVIALDIRGKDIYQQQYDLKDHQYLYFNNLAVQKDSKSEKLQPYGHRDQCDMRRESIKKRFDTAEKPITSLSDTLKILSTLDDHQGQEWKLSPSTISSIQTIGFNTKENTALQLTGEAPKIFNHSPLIQWKQLFSNPSQEVLHLPSDQPSAYQLGYKHWAKSQSYFDRGEIEEAYHYLQIAIDRFEGFAEEHIAQFYFEIWQFIYFDNEKELPYLYEGFLSLEGKLPPYLEDHRLLFLARIQNILGYPIEDMESKIVNPQLKLVFKEESEKHPMILKIMRKLIYPRMEILDIIYLYSQYK